MTTPAAGVVYQGTLDGDALTGEWEQGGTNSLVLRRVAEGRSTALVRDDDRVWDRTHRVARHALMGASVLLAGLWAALDATTFSVAVAAATVGLVAFAVAYPWWLSRRLPPATEPTRSGRA